MSLWYSDQTKLRAARERAAKPDKTTKAKLAGSLSWCLQEMQTLANRLDQIGPDGSRAESRADERIERMSKALDNVKGILGGLLEAAAETHVRAVQEIDKAVSGR